MSFLYMTHCLKEKKKKILYFTTGTDATGVFAWKPVWLWRPMMQCAGVYGQTLPIDGKNEERGLG